MWWLTPNTSWMTTMAPLGSSGWASYTGIGPSGVSTSVVPVSMGADPTRVLPPPPLWRTCPRPDRVNCAKGRLLQGRVDAVGGAAPAAGRFGAGVGLGEARAGVLGGE